MKEELTERRSIAMPLHCAICGREPSGGHTRKLLRGHRNITAKRRFRPNLQPTLYQGHRVWACVRCRRTQLKAAKVHPT